VAAKAVAGRLLTKHSYQIKRLEAFMLIWIWKRIDLKSWEDLKGKNAIRIPR